MLPRPGKVQIIDFPVVMTGEVDGTIFLTNEGKTSGIGNALIELVAPDGQVIATARSASDGYYCSCRPARQIYCTHFARTGKKIQSLRRC